MGKLAPGALAALRLSARAECVYRMVADGLRSFHDACRALALNGQARVDVLIELSDRGLVERTDDALQFINPAVATERANAARCQDVNRAGTALLQLSHGVDDAVASGPQADITTALIGRGDINELVFDLFARTSREVLNTRAWSAKEPIPLKNLDETQEQEMKQDIVATGVNTRAIYAAVCLEKQHTVQEIDFFETLGHHSRVLADLTSHFSVFDRRIALMPLTTPSSQGVLVVRAPAVIDALVQLFEVAWATSRPLVPQPRRTRDAAVSPLQRTALQLLALGHKDVTIARALGVSGRSLTRLIAELQERAQADSRFQLALYAIEMGWFEER